MAIPTYSVVRIIGDSISVAGGAERAVNEGTLGRVCRRTPGGMYRVALQGGGCVLVGESRLRVVNDAGAPDCTDCG